MTKPPSTPPILSELRSPSSPASQVAALRALKNEIIGHEQKKEMWVGLGVIIQLARILNSYKASGKRKHKEISGGVDNGSRKRSRTDEEEARLQAIIIVSALAHGGPAYIQPLTLGSIFPPLLSILNPADSHPQLVLAGLRALNSVADSLLLEEPTTEPADGSLLRLLYSDLHLATIIAILNQSSPTLIVQQQLSLAAALISKTCREENQRIQLAQAGVLEALACRLASFVVATGSCSHTFWGTSDASSSSPPPATTKSRLSPILQAIASVITKSKTRTKQFISSPVFTTIFPKTEICRDNSTNSFSSPYGGHHWYFSTHGHNSSHSLDSPYRDASAQMSNFPPLGALGPARGNVRNTRGYSAALETISTEGYSGVEGNETPLIAWLVYVVRAETGVTRLMTAWVLTILYRMGFANHRREVGLALLLVPLLVCMLDKNYAVPSNTPTSYDDSVLQSPEQLIAQHAPTVLSLLVEDHFQLQQAAVDAKAIEKLSQLLKRSFDPLPASPTSLWTPHPRQRTETSSQDITSPSRIGLFGLSPDTYHRMRMRESVLVALAAIATAKDEYRKTIIDSGVVQFVIDSLKPYDETPLDISDSSQPTSVVTGNPTPVLLAACGAARALSRSVNTLRTSLIDAGLAAPLFVLLRHPELEVQVASTAVVCNLLLEFSPMRETMIEAGILKILCEHAHSMNAKLRLNAMWALKHLANTAPNSLKMSCLEELGPGWLKQIISNDAEDMSHPVGCRGDRDSSTGIPMAMGTPNAAGEQVDLLNAVDEDTTGPLLVADHDEEDEVNMIDSTGELGSSRDPTTFDPLRTYFDKKMTEDQKRPATKVDLEIQAGLQARKDDLAVQEQALKFIQNLICGPEAAEMIDYLFRELGQDKFFDILTVRLQPKIPDLFRRNRKSSENSLRHIPPPTEIVKGVCYIVVHIAAGSPRHRQLLMSQHELLLLLVPLFGHPNKEIRSTCAWLVINLTWDDDQSDRLHCKSRAYELRKLGILDKLKELETDPELDVRERTKTALHQLSNLLH